MANELAITRDDIERWTKDAITQTVEKYLNGVDIEALANKAVQNTAHRTVHGSWGDNGTKLREALAKELANQISIVTKN